MQKKNSEISKSYIIMNIIFVVIFFVLEVIALLFFKDAYQFKLLFKVIARGEFGIMLLYNSYYHLFTAGQSILDPKQSKRQRLVTGILLAVVGFGMLITALLGYGTNGDPRLYWWR